MENYRMDLLCLSMGIFLLLCAKADAYDYNPLGNVNLSPFSQMRSAWECMQNFSEACTSSKDVLKLEGVVNVSKAEVPEYCKSGGCGEHTKHVLTCVFYVKRDFTFANGATVHNITGTIERGCTTNSSFNTNFKASAIRTYQNLIVPLVASLATLVIVNIFNV